VPITGSGSLREILFTAPADLEYEDLYAVHWNGSCVLQHLYAPNGSDVLKLEKRGNYGTFKWGFVYLSYKPEAFATQYGFQGMGVWKIQMRVIDPDVPSLYAPNAFMVWIEKTEYNETLVELQSGESKAISFDLAPRLWQTGDIRVSIEANSSQVNVSGAILEDSYHYISDIAYDYSDWNLYSNRIVITNIWSKKLYIRISWSNSIFRHLDLEAEGSNLRFAINNSIDLSEWQTSLNISSISQPLSSYALCVPNGSRVEDLNSIMYGTSYESPHVVYGSYELSIDTYYASELLGVGDMLGNWHLKTGAQAIINCSTATPLVGEPMTFDGTNSIYYGRDIGGIISYAWDFGDGSHGEGAVVQHSYSKTGTYNVTLTVKDNRGLNDTAKATVKAQNMPPKFQSVTYTPKEPLSGYIIKQDVEVTAIIIEPNDSSEVKNVTLWFRVNVGEWQPRAMTLIGNEWKCTIPGQNVGARIEFYVESYDYAGNIAVTAVQSYLTAYMITEIVLLLSLLFAVIFIAIAYMIKRKKGQGLQK